jgi:hypothetical protein
MDHRYFGKYLGGSTDSKNKTVITEIEGEKQDDDDDYPSHLESGRLPRGSIQVQSGVEQRSYETPRG